MWGWNPPAWAQGLFSVYPIEYKKGKPKITEEDKLQLAAQAMCLEEMFSTQIPEGALFYGETKRREIVEITEELRSEVREMFQEMHQYYERRYTPKVKMGKNCTSCSLKELCMPRLAKTGSVKTIWIRCLWRKTYEKLLNTLYVTSETVTWR